MPQFVEKIWQSPVSELDFEELLLEISTNLISLPVDAIDNVIEATQRKVCESMGLDLSALWQWSDRDANLMTITHLYTIPGGPQQARYQNIDGAKAFPYVYSKMLAGDTFPFSNSELPDEASIDLESRRLYGVESSVAVPLVVGGQHLMGLISFDILNRERKWKSEEVKRLKLVADIFANTLARKQTVRQLIESEERLGLAAESAEAGLWELDCSTDKFWTTEQANALFGYPPGETVSMKRIEASVHPDDLEIVRSSLSLSFQNREKLSTEYRIALPDGTWKWICSRGRPAYDDNGLPASMRGVSIDISERKKLEEQQQIHLREIESLKQQIEQENFYLREDLKKIQGFEHVVGESKGFKTVLQSAKQVAPTSATVLITGETGTGKGVIANTIHQMSEHKDRSFVTVNCAALPRDLIESELFGREKGAFTGAHKTQVGRFEIANHGTIFLDEIGEVPLEMQAKLLRVLQEGEFERLGSPRTISVEVRVIAATARDLREDVKNGRFREDLFYRINVYPIELPPLRERPDDIPLLAQYFVEKFSHKFGKEIDRISKRALDALINYAWPGNVRELEHLIERSTIISSGNTLVINDQILPVIPASSHNSELKNLESNERDHINRILEVTNWKIEGPGGAATILDIHPSTLRFRLKKLGIKRPF